MEPIKGTVMTGPPQSRAGGLTAGRDRGFVEELKRFTRGVDASLKEVDRMTAAFAAGESYEIHDVLIASEKASIRFKLLMQIRNKLLDAYQEIMRMQV